MHFLEDEGGCTPFRGIFRGKFYDGLFDAASSHNSPTAGRNKSAQYVNYNYRQEYPCNHTRVRLGRLGRRLFICGRMKSRLPPHSPFHSYFCFITLSLAFEGLRRSCCILFLPSSRLRISDTYQPISSSLNRARPRAKCIRSSSAFGHPQTVALR